MNKFIKLSIFVICLMILCIFLHESTHSIIYKYYGCENIKLNINNLPFISMNAECSTLDNNMLLAHSINEVIGYNIVPILVIICSILYYKLIDYEVIKL